VNGKKLILNSLIFSVLNFLHPLSSFILLPLYLKHLNVNDYAIFSLMTNLSGFVSLISALGIGSSVITFYYNFNMDQEKLDRFIYNIICFSILANVCFFLLILPFGNFLFNLFFSSSEILFYPFGALGVGIGCISTITIPYMIFLKNQNNIKLYTLLTLLSIVLTVFFQYFSLVNLNLSVKGLLWSKLLGTLFPTLIILIKNFSQSRLYFDFKIILPSLFFSLRFLPSSLFAWANSFFDRIIIENYLDLKKLGIYSLVLTFTSLIEMLYLAIGSAVQPVLYELFCRSEEKIILNNKINQMFIFYLHSVLIGLSSLILLVTNIDLFIQNPDYLKVKEFVAISGFSFFLSAYIYIFMLNIFYYKKTNIMVLIQLFSFILLVVLEIILIPLFEINGVIYVTLLLKSIVFVFCYVASQKIYKIDYNNFKIFYEPFLIITSIFCLHLFAKYTFFTWNQFGIIQFIFVIIYLFAINKTKIFNFIKLQKLYV
jgi:O-antigen/teichoic acid export membrane protein